MTAQYNTSEQQDDNADGLTPQQLRADEELNQMCEVWAHWCRTRRFFGPPPLGASVLGKLQKRPALLRPQVRDWPCSSKIMALHMAIVSQPADAIDTRVFRLHYEYRVKNIKATCSLLGISRAHWYRLLREFRRRVHAGSLPILQAFDDERDAFDANRRPS